MGMARKETEAKWQGREAISEPSTWERSTPVGPAPVEELAKSEPDQFCGRCGHTIKLHRTGICTGDRTCFCKRVFDDV